MTSTTELVAGRYRLGRLLARGGMSDVHEALDTVTGSRVALKLVRSGDPTLSQRLAQEASVLERLDHPGLIRLLDAGVAGQQSYLVMELFHGSPLTSVLQEGPLGYSRTAALGARVAGALAYAHERGVVHRDVKPANILVARDDEVRLADFGIARLIDASTLTLSGTTLGTASYMAPEQLKDNQVGPSADIWSLGLVLLECLTGERVYGGSPGEVVARRLARKGKLDLPGGLPAPFGVVLSAMLDERPGRRLDALESEELLLAATKLATDHSKPVTVTAVMPAAAGVEPPPAGVEPTAAGVEPTAVLVGTTQLPRQPEEAGAPTRALIPLRVRHLGRAPVEQIGRWAAGRGWSPALKGAGLLCALGILLVMGLTRGGTTPPRQRDRALAPHPHTAAKLSASARSAAPRRRSVLTPSRALDNLVRDLIAGAQAGEISTARAKAIADLATQAVDAETGHRPSHAIDDLARAARAIAAGAENGSITESEARRLQGALSQLRATLGLTGDAQLVSANRSFPPPTTAPPPPPRHGHGGGGPGPGHGHRPGHGEGPGQGQGPGHGHGGGAPGDGQAQGD